MTDQTPGSDPYAQAIARVESSGPPPAPAGHVYLSTGCLHGQHAYCQSNTGLNGAKRPGECKFCTAKCVCHCHRGQEPTP